MKVCILSMQRVGNMGSLLQSYALKTTIERLGHQVEFIDIEKREDDYKLLGDYKQKYDKEKETSGLGHFVGSKYVKSNPVGIYDKVVEKLKNGNSVLFIGLPCQVAAVKNYMLAMSDNIRENLYTVDLICHGSPSPKILKLALYEKGMYCMAVQFAKVRGKITEEQ